MASLEVKKNVCKSCKGIDHKRNTSKLCPNSYWGKKRTTDRLDALLQLKESLKKFEDFILQENITMDQLAPAYCSNWMEIERYSGNRTKWNLDYYLGKKLIDLHFDIACKVYVTPLDNDILNIVSERTKIIYGIVGSNAGDIWYNTSYTNSYTKAHFGTTKLMKFWGVTIETENKIY